MCLFSFKSELWPNPPEANLINGARIELHSPTTSSLQLSTEAFVVLQDFCQAWLEEPANIQLPNLPVDSELTMLRRLFPNFPHIFRGGSHLVDPTKSAPPTIMVDRECQMFQPILQPGAKIAIDSWLTMMQNQAEDGFFTDSLHRTSLLTVQAIWHCKTGGLMKKSSCKNGLTYPIPNFSF